MVSDYMHLRVAPVMELTNQASQSLYLSVHVSDECIGARMPEVVHLLMPKDHEQGTESRWARSNILQVFDIMAIGAKISQEGKPVCAYRSVFPVYLRVQGIVLNVQFD